MITIRVLNNKDFDSLVTLVIKLYKLINPERDSYQSINDFLTLVNTRIDFTAIGLFKENKLIGCIYGYALTKNTWYISGLYCRKNPKGLKDLLDFLKDHLKVKGYIHYEGNTNQKVVKRLVKNRGAQELSIRFKGEL